ncbi:hypothetical protein GCM10020220_085540 [Nonomuraea rubra]
MLTVLVRPDLSKDAELLVLRHENQVLRRQVGGQPRWGHADRLWLTALSRLIHRRRWAEVFPVTPATILRWHRHLVARKWTFTDRRRPGRPSADGSGEPHLGHRRIQGELARLGYPIAASTVWEILHTAGISPAPRRAGPTWRQFLTAQAHAIIACDFLAVETVLLKRLYVLVFIEHGTRRPHLAGVSAHPTGAWTVQQARNLIMVLGERERVIGTLRRELLDRILILNERHLARVLQEYLIHYNGRRPHQSRRQRPPDLATQPSHDVTNLDDLRSIRRKPVVAGMIGEYHHAA